MGKNGDWEQFSEELRRKAEQLDASWDAEQALRGRKDNAHAAAERIGQRQIPSQRPTPAQPQRATPPQRSVPSQRQPQARPARKAPSRKRRVNWKGYGILALIAAIIIAALILLISLIVKAVKPKKATPPATTIPTTTVEATQSPEERAAELIGQADRLAVTYDYDGALATLAQFGSDWETQPQLAAAKADYEQKKGELVRWKDTTTIPHVSYHSLIVDTERAFDGDSDQDGYNQYMTTVKEFRAMLQQMYDRGFVLVSIHDIAKAVTAEDGTTTYEQGEIYLPEGKKPLVLSQTDLNYYEYMVDGDGDHTPDAKGDGFANRLMIDENGDPTCAYVTADGKTVYGEYDLVPILESFIKEHPDFSYRGARALLAVTGYEGVLGYQTHPKWQETLGEDAYMAQVRQAQAVAQCLREHGYEFASHSFAHIGYGNNSATDVSDDVQKWDTQVKPIVGETDVLIYPYGNDIGGIEKYSGDKFDTLYAAGFRFFCNADASTTAWVQIRSGYVRQARRNADGYRMQWMPDALSDLFDVSQVFDEARPTPVPSIV